VSFAVYRVLDLSFSQKLKAFFVIVIFWAAYDSSQLEERRYEVKKEYQEDEVGCIQIKTLKT